MDIESFFNLFIEFLPALIGLLSVIILSKTISSNANLNKQNLFNEIVKQERELRIKLIEYKMEMHKLGEYTLKSRNNNERINNLKLDYDTLLFNYYEYVSICIYRKLVEENETKRYFETLLSYVFDQFDNSALFRGGFAKREEYPGLQWLFKRWKIK